MIARFVGAGFRGLAPRGSHFPLDGCARSRGDLRFRARLRERSCVPGSAAPTGARNKSPALDRCALCARSHGSDVAWVDPPPRTSLVGGHRDRRARSFARSTRGEPHDLYLVRARLSPEGSAARPVERLEPDPHPERRRKRPLVDGQLAVYTAAIEGVTTSIFALDLSRERELARDELSESHALRSQSPTSGDRAARGRHPPRMDVRPLPFVGRSHLAREPIESSPTVAASCLPREGQDALEGGELVRPHRTARARPGNLVTWAVDRVRNLSWFGDERMQTLKAATFTVADVLRAGREVDVRATPAQRTSPPTSARSRNAKPVTYTDPETGWPPAADEAVHHARAARRRAVGAARRGSLRPRPIPGARRRS